jgi:hypothetical protein
MFDLGALAAGESIAEAINLPGEIVSRSSLTGSATMNDGSGAYVWSSGTGMTGLGTLGGTSTTPSQSTPAARSPAKAKPPLARRTRSCGARVGDRGSGSGAMLDRSRADRRSQQ